MMQFIIMSIVDFVVWLRGLTKCQWRRHTRCV